MEKRGGAHRSRICYQRDLPRLVYQKFNYKLNKYMNTGRLRAKHCHCHWVRDDTQTRILPPVPPPLLNSHNPLKCLTPSQLSLPLPCRGPGFWLLATDVSRLKETFRFPGRSHKAAYIFSRPTGFARGCSTNNVITDSSVNWGVSILPDCCSWQGVTHVTEVVCTSIRGRS